MKKDISKYIKECKSCIRNKKLKHTKENLVITETPNKPFDIVQVDLSLKPKTNMPLRHNAN